ncbi:uncharacterized protein LOC116344160 [Contarinia nasturtii]|uniref:uncharacterized protein LOC116344160 n=1 Tax=Contarinia nasturtii TaxID=265458 RepID=UPI0012D46DB5|nr:uncharacterized protein LOC116344160 [Contarinia nasturtii]
MTAMSRNVPYIIPDLNRRMPHFMRGDKKERFMKKIPWNLESKPPILMQMGLKPDKMSDVLFHRIDSLNDGQTKILPTELKIIIESLKETSPHKYIPNFDELFKKWQDRKLDTKRVTDIQGYLDILNRAREGYNNQFTTKIAKIQELKKSLSIQMEECTAVANQILGLKPLVKTIEKTIVDFETLPLS